MFLDSSCTLQYFDVCLSCMSVMQSLTAMGEEQAQAAEVWQGKKDALEARLAEAEALAQVRSLMGRQARSLTDWRSRVTGPAAGFHGVRVRRVEGEANEGPLIGQNM